MNSKQQVEHHLRSAMTSLDCAADRARSAGHTEVAKAIKGKADEVVAMLLLLAWQE